MYQAPFSYEDYVRDAIDRIAADRAATAPLPAETPGFVASIRQRVGTVLITVGERVGGPAVRRPRPVTPRPSHTPLLA